MLVCGRVKPHTSFAGDFQSGLMKMLLIGLGKQTGANIYHRAIEDYSFDQIVRSVAREVLQKCRVVAGLAIVENAYDETALIEAVEPSQFEARETQLLALARQWMARLPFDAVDVLVIDRMGKNISGVGFDPNVVGRKFNDHQAVAGETPKVKRICLRSLTPESHGNAIGLGMAEFCRTQLLRDMDPRITRVNSLTSGHIAAGMTPLDYETDREMLQAALGTVGLVEPPQRPAALDRRHARPGRSGMLGRVFRSGPGAERSGGHRRAAGNGVRRGGKSAGRETTNDEMANDQSWAASNLRFVIQYFVISSLSLPIVSSHLHLQGPQHPHDGRLLLVDKRHVVQHDRLAVVAGVDDQAAGLKQEKLEDVVDLLFHPQVRGGEPFQVAEEAVMVQQLVAADLPIVEPHDDRNHREHRPQDEGQRRVEVAVGHGVELVNEMR